MKMIAVSLIVLLSASGCKEEDKAVVKGRIKDAWGQLSDSDHVRTRGVGLPPADVIGQTARRARAREAGLVAARWEMMSLVKGVRITGQITVGDLMISNVHIAEIAERVLSGAEEKSCDFTADDAAVVVVEIRRDQVEQIIEADRRYEEPTPRERWEAENRKAELAASMYHPDFDGKRPITALGLGILMPGLGQIYASEPGNYSGFYTLGMTAAIVEVGDYFYSPHPIGQGPNGSQNMGRAKDLGIGLFGLAGILWGWAAIDGMHIVQGRASVTLEPRGSGAALAVKF